MLPLTQLYLDREALTYLKTGLDRVATGLCTYLASLPLNDGTVYTMVPPGTSPERANHFENGGLMSMDAGEAWLANHVVTSLAADSHGTLVFQDAWGAHPQDIAFQSAKSAKFTNDGDTYYYVHNSTPTLHLIHQLLKDLQGYARIGILTHFGRTGVPDVVINSDCLKELAANTRELYLSIYDQEGFLVWQRNKHAQ
jgi:hypothetical protein